jgi:hypothetical protein
MTPCSLVDVYQHFGREYCLSFEGRKKAKQVTSKKEATSRKWRQYIPPKRRLHGVTSQETIVFIVIALGIWNRNSHCKFWNHHHHLHGLRLLGCSILIHQTIFFLAFLDHVFLSADWVAWEFFLMTFFANVQASFSSFRVFVCPASSFPVVT